MFAPTTHVTVCSLEDWRFVHTADAVRFCVRCCAAPHGIQRNATHRIRWEQIFTRSPQFRLQAVKSAPSIRQSLVRMKYLGLFQLDLAQHIARRQTFGYLPAVGHYCLSVYTAWCTYVWTTCTRYLPDNRTAESWIPGPWVSCPTP